MDWLGSISSNLRGQLSNITKDLLAEEGSTVDDPRSELEIAKLQLVELQQYSEGLKNEVETLRLRNDELQVQLESSELRINHMKEQFRAQLTEKEALIAELRTELSSGRGEPEGQSSVRFQVSSSSSALLENVDSDVEFASEERSLHTNDGRATWQELRDEVVKLRSEVTFWRDQASKNVETQKMAEGDSVHHLRDTIETLKQQLADEVKLRQSELITLHNDHTNRLEELVGQLRISESEVLDLRNRLKENRREPIEEDTSTISTFQLEEDNSLLSSSRRQTGSKKKQRGAHKKKRLGGELLASSPGKPEKTAVPLPTLKDACTQTEQEVSDNSSDYEKLELTSDGTQTPPMCSETAQVQVVPDHQSTGVQTLSETHTVSTQVDDSDSLSDRPASLLMVDATSAPAKNSGSSTSQQASEAELSIQLTSSVTCPSPPSTSSGQLNTIPTGPHLTDLVGQVNDCVINYTSVVNDLARLVQTDLPSLDATDAVSDLTRKLSGLSKQLTDMQEGLMFRLEELFSVCRLVSDDREAAAVALSNTPTSSPPPSTSSSLVVPVTGSQTELSVQQPSTDPHHAAKHASLTDWQADCFDVVPSAGGHDNDEDVVVGETQIVGTDQSTGTSVAALHATINDLKAQLSSTTAMYSDQLEEARSSAGQLRAALHSAIVDLTSAMPSLPYAGEWPPQDPSAQLAILVTAEAAARSELGRVFTRLHQAEMSMMAAEAEKDELQAQLDGLDRSALEPPTHTTQQSSVPLQASDTGSTSKPDDKEDEDDAADESAGGLDCEEDPLDLVYRLCAHLSTDIPEELWDPQRWDVTLYSVLRHHFGDAEPSSPLSDRVIQLTAEVTALRDILGQQAAVRSQLEHDLQQLLATVATQRDRIQAFEEEEGRRERNVKSSPSSPDTSLNQFCAQVMELLVDRAKSLNIPTPVDTSGDGSVKDNALQLLEHLLHQLSTSSNNLVRLQESHESVVLALKEKHLESQRYHCELQRVRAELSGNDESRQSMQGQLAFLEEESRQLKEKLTDANEIHNKNLSDLEKAQRRVEELEATVQSIEASASQTVDSGTESTANEARLSAEVDRLQTHLIEMEQCYTSQAMQAESRELGLRSRLSDLETRLSVAVELSESADQRVSQAHTERDSLSATVEAQSKEINALRSNLSNLQMALDGFQQNERSAVALETEYLNHELQRARQAQATASTEQADLRRQLVERDACIDQLRQLQESVERSSDNLERLENQVQQRDSEIERLKSHLTKLAVDTDSKIDKILIKNLLLSYLQLPSSQRQNGLRVIGSLLNFSDADFAKVNSNAGLFGWVRGAFANLPAGPPRDVTFSSVYPDKSFTELLLAFLEQEASHQTPLKLPVDYYTPDTVRQSSGSRRQTVLNEWSNRGEQPSPYFNPTPFSSPTTRDREENSSRSEEKKVATNPLFSL